MTRSIRVIFSVAALFLVACSDLAAPTRSNAYDWRLIVTFDSLGPQLDTLSFHWPRSRLPVRIYVEDAGGLPDDVRQGIDQWKAAFLYGEWDAKITSDSNNADVIVRLAPPPPVGPKPSAGRLGSMLLPQCDGATDLDTVATRFELRIPLRVYVNPLVPSTDPDLARCLRVTTAHELGHSLGIFQHSSDANDLMFTQPAVDPLSRRDINTVQTLYHFPPDMVPVGP
jgi:hypothetical protein